jgi:RecB family exonuclease
MQQRSLIRARDLAGFRAALVELVRRSDPLSARHRAVIVPTHAAAELLRQTIEADALRRGPRAVILPDLVTRDEWMARLHAALPHAPPMLTRIEREVLLASAASRTASRARMPGRPFRIRPGLVAGMLDFYDELQRRQRTVRRFARALFDQLRVERGTDRGSESLIHQTSFLGLVFLAYQRGVAASGGMDEHVLRRALLRDQPALPVDHVIVAVADHPSDPRGLWPADFDLLGRLRGLERLDIVVTDETHDAGFRERVEGELPGIEAAHWDGPDSDRASLVIRPPGDAEAVCWTSRDREEELRDVARRIRQRAGETGGEIRESVAVVFARRLPYLYLARQVFPEAGVPFQTFDALPLGAEPWAALLDVVLTVARTGGTRDAAVALLRSRMLRIEVDGVAVGLRDAAALDAALAERRATGEADSYPAEVDAWFGARATREHVDRRRASRAATAAASARASLLPFRDAARASDQVRALVAFLRGAGHSVAGGDPWRERQLRARAAVLGVLDELAAAFRRYDDHPRDPDDLTAAIHHAIEAQMFSPRRGQSGVHLVDAVAARFGEFDHVHLVGLVETDWPERSRRSVFYTSGLLKTLGWPQEADQGRAQMAEFRDLLGLAAGTLSLHAFQFEGDAVVALSPMIEFARDRPSRVAAPAPWRRTFADEVLTAEVIPAGVVDGAEADWLALRQERPALDDPRYRGVMAPVADAGSPAAGYRVSRVDRYVTCPFKYFAENVLGLPEERDAMSGLTPLERGTLVHGLFEAFYRAWQADGLGTITPETLPVAIDLFGRITRTALAALPPADRVLEETRLVGSIVARGLAERVFELEADAGGTIVDRLIEFDLRGPFTFPALGGLRPTTIEIRGKADRIDVFADGSLRVVDYKLGRVPDKSSIQIGVYAHCAKQWLEHRDDRPHPVAAAMYLAFGDDEDMSGRLGGRNDPVALAVEARAAAFAGHVAQIEAGQFPARPRKLSECAYCGYAGVCRKEYSLEPDAAADESDAGEAG